MALRTLPGKSAAAKRIACSNSREADGNKRDPQILTLIIGDCLESLAAGQQFEYEVQCEWLKSIGALSRTIYKPSASTNL
jgi:hypothetical protein